MNHLYWLPHHPDFRAALNDVKQSDRSVQEQLQNLQKLAGYNLDFTQTIQVDRYLQKLLTQIVNPIPGFSTIKLAILAASTVDHLPAAIRVAALQRGVLVECYVAPYGQYRQELLDPSSTLYRFAPEVVLLALNAQEVRINQPLGTPLADITAAITHQLEEWEHLWQIARTRLQATVIHQTIVIPPERLFSQYDAVLPSTASSILYQLNASLRIKATEQHILLLDIDGLAAQVGKQNWCDPILWHHSKQDISPVYAPLYSDQVARILSAIRGLSRKCLVLDLDNTLWGGVIGDDGLEGIQLGQGNAVGEAYQAFQAYVKALKQRGVILAVCSKNEEVNALEAFERHSEMVLTREDIAAFSANWDDKATNLEIIAQQLNIGLDSLVFFDDNPVERGLVRQMLPAVAVPEVPEDPALYVRCLSDAGYFEAIAFSADDLARSDQYQANQERERLKKTTHDLQGFLKQLNMQMTVSNFDTLSLPRITQLINKSNQFNLTTRRYTETQVKQFADDAQNLCLQIRLKDDFGDNGLISVVIAKPINRGMEKILHIDTWLMSCRVLGRQVEQEVLNQLVTQAQHRGFAILQGEYISTAKNQMVRNHYANLGFSAIREQLKENGTLHSIWQLKLQDFIGFDTFIHSTVVDSHIKELASSK